jgi:hypothetical protein
MTPQKYSSKSRQGVALVIVLAMLVLLSGLIVAFFNSVRTERNATKADASTASARMIADSTTNMVIAQIREATTRYTETATWASQPGAIRTFSGKQGGKVQLEKGAYQYGYEPGGSDFVYKLYSSDNLRVPASDYNIGGPGLKEDTEAISRWLDDPFNPIEGYVDLNEPFVSRIADPKSGSGFFYEPRYPILDPRARADAAEKESTNTFGIVEGFDAVPVINPDDDRRTLLRGQIALLPMPVKWLYVLKDGTIGPIDRATDENPVVGRTAFWTDDESTKLNINTATEGTFWDTPSVSSVQEAGEVDRDTKKLVGDASSLALAASQPLRNEYQRYPGHTATTCLSPVFGWIWNLSRTTPMTNRNAQYNKFKEAIYKMAPFTQSGSPTSLGGSDNPDRFDNPPGALLTADKDPKVLTATKHLYNNVDEYIFQAKRFNDSGGLLNDDSLTGPKLEKVRGFITANSRASELNLFNRPRVTIWPLNELKPKRTHFDNLFAFTSTLGEQPFHFVRLEAKDPSIDVKLPQNVEMLRYLKWITGDSPRTAIIPGFGKNFAEKYVGTERDQILTLIFDYVRCVNLVDTGTGRIGALQFIPYTPFFGQGQAGYGNVPRSFDWSGQVTPTETPTDHPLAPGLKGMGRFLTISEAAIVFYRTGTDIAPVDPKVQTGMRAMFLFETATTMPGFPALRDTYFTKLTVKEPFYVTPIFKDAAGKDVPGTRTIIFDPDKDVDLLNMVNLSSHEIMQGRGFMPTLGFANGLAFLTEHKRHTNTDLYPSDPNRNPSDTMTFKTFRRAPAGASMKYVRSTGPGAGTLPFYPYEGPDPDLKPNGVPMFDATTKKFATEFLFEGGKIEVEIWTGECPPEQGASLNWARRVQTIELDYSPTPQLQSFKLLTPDGLVGTNCDIENRLKTNHFRTPGGRPHEDRKPDFFRVPIKDDMTDPGNYIDNSQNCTIVRSLEFVGPATGSQAGDLRLGASRKIVPSSYYAPRDPAVWGTATRWVHAFNTGHGDNNHLYGFSTSRGVLAKGSEGVTHTNNKYQILPSGIKGVTMKDGQNGDWDRGISKHMDGAFGNKVDEGNVYFEYTNNTVSYRVPYFRGRGIEETGQSFFSPNRQLSSPVMFGSLPTGVQSGKPWQTLLFRPDRSTTPHPGASIPEDHLLLDFFHLPIVEPFAISEPFATSGKVNLNYVMAPFGYLTIPGKNLPRSRPGTGTAAPTSYIHRDTALRGVLRSTKIMAVPAAAGSYAHIEQCLQDGTKYRFDIDEDETIAHIQKRLLDPRRGLFRSASEICTVDLYPIGPAVSNWQQFWDTTYTQTGDNMRERPYSYIYPRVTTKSNVYTIHMRCQAVTIAPTAKVDGKIDYKNVKEEDVKVQAEYRGSAIIERFVDPNDLELKRYKFEQGSVDPYYRFRVIANKQFNPR